MGMTPGFSPKDVLEKIKAGNIRAVDLRFIDPFGMWHHFTLPSTMVNEGSFTDGHGFDGSSIRGWKAIDESDMLVVPDPNSAVIDPFFAEPTLVMLADVVDPITKEDYARDPRGVARRCEQYLASTGLGDRMYVGPEPEFFIFDSVRWDTQPHSSFYAIDSDEGPWQTGNELAGHGYRVRNKGGYLPVPPADQLQDLRGEMMRTMELVGIEMERQHHEVASAGQAEIDMKYDTLVSMADKLQWFKYIVKQCAVRAGKTATFMPKPMYGDNGSGMHVHFSIWKGKTNLFAGSGYAGLSDTGRWAIGGLLRHAHAVIAFTNPTTNSYRRLVPHFEAPIKLAYSSRKPLGGDPHPDVQQQPGGQALRVPLPGPAEQRLPRLRGHRDGLHRRHPEPHRSGPAAGQEHLRPPARGDGPGGGRADLAGGRARVAAEGPRIPAARRRLQQGADRDLREVEVRERGPDHEDAAAPARVLDVLRRVMSSAVAGAKPASRGRFAAGVSAAHRCAVCCGPRAPYVRGKRASLPRRRMRGGERAEMRASCGDGAARLGA